MINQGLTRLANCAPFIRTCGLELLAKAKTKLGLTLLVVRGYEDVQQQWDRYKLGRAKVDGVWKVINEGAIVTNAPPGRSGHNVITKAGTPAAICFDVIPLDTAQQPLWAKPGEQPHQLQQRWIDTYGRTEEACWAQLYELAWDLGLDPLGDATGAYLKWDKGHFEEPGYKFKLDDLGLMLPNVGLAEMA